MERPWERWGTYCRPSKKMSESETERQAVALPTSTVSPASASSVKRLPSLPGTSVLPLATAFFRGAHRWIAPYLAGQEEQHQPPLVVQDEGRVYEPPETPSMSTGRVASSPRCPGGSGSTYQGCRCGASGRGESGRAPNPGKTASQGRPASALHHRFGPGKPDGQRGSHRMRLWCRRPGKLSGRAR